MTDKPDELVLQQLQHIRATADKANAKLGDLEAHLIELRLQVAGLIR